MGILKTEKRKLKKKDMRDLEHTDYEVWKKGLAEWDEEKQEMEFDINVIDTGLCWRLVHDNERVLALFEGDGETSSVNTLFAGTKQECLDEIARLNLAYEPEPI